MQPLEVAVKLDETFDLSACTNQRFLNWGKRNPKKKKKQNKKTLAILLRQELPLGKS